MKQSVLLLIFLLLSCLFGCAPQSDLPAPSDTNIVSVSESLSDAALHQTDTDLNTDTNPAETSPVSAKDKILKSALYLSCNTDSATANGVIISITSDEILILTNAHVAALINPSAGSAYAQATDSYPPFPVEVVYTDDKTDLAFLTAKKDTLDDDLLSFILPVSFSSFSYDNLKKGDVLTNLYLDRLDPTGFFYPESGLGEAVLLNKNVPVEGFDENMMYLDYLSLKGMSGSGIFDSEGNLVGLLSAGDEQQGTTLAVPLPDILSALEEACPVR